VLIIFFEGNLTDFHTKVDDRREYYDRILPNLSEKVMSCFVGDIHLSVRMMDLSPADP
jgi:hypothetical protein